MRLDLQLVCIINRKSSRRNFSHLLNWFISLESVSQVISQEMKMEINPLTETPYGLVLNDTLYDYDEVLCNYGSEADYRHIAIPIILSTVIIFSLIGNMLVVVISVFCVRLQSLTSIFILNLALSDLIFTVGLVFWFCEFMWGWTFGDAACYIAIFLLSAGFYSSVVFLMLMSVQCYMAVLHPLSGWKKGRCFTYVLIIAWMASILASFPASVHSTLIADSKNLVFYCTYSTITVFVAVTYEENIIFVCAFIVMAFCYIMILQTIFKSPRNHRTRTTTLAFLLVATYFFFWAPYNILNFVHNLIFHEIKMVTQCEFSHLNYTSYICQLLAFTRCCLNPVIYGLSGVKFHKTVREVLQRRANFIFEHMRMVDHQPDGCVH